MTRKELIKAQLDYVKLTEALNKPLKDLKQVGSTKVVLILKHAPTINVFLKKVKKKY